MFCHIFGEYLVEKKKLTENQLSSVIDYLKTIRVKLGFIAVAEKLLTEEQVHEINLMQNTIDKRFGDIAVTKGDLTKEQLSYLLSLQGNEYLQFVQAITDLGYMTLEEFEEALMQYQEEAGFTSEELESIKSGDIDRVADVMIHMNDKNSNELARLCLRNINRFISNNFYFGRAYSINELEVDRLVYQCVTGNENWFLGFASDSDGLLSMSNLYAKEVYDCLNDEALDSVQEFINCTNGLYVTKLNHMEHGENLKEPEYCENCVIAADNDMYVVPVNVNGKQVEILIGMNSEISF